jgi:hypothetical protein
MRELYDKFGIPLDDDYLAPGDGDETVDNALIRGYYDETLPPGVEERVEYLIAHFVDWHDASRKYLLSQPPGELEPVPMHDRFGRRRKALIGGILALAASLAFALLWPWRSPSFTDGDVQVALMRDGRVSGLDNYDAAWREAAGDAFQKGLPLPAEFERLANAASANGRGDQRLSAAILRPYLTAVQETQPELVWKGSQDANRYRVEVFEVGGADPVRVEETVSSVWRVSPPLTRGTIYWWRVAYLVGNRTLSTPSSNETPAVFCVISDETVQRIKVEERNLSDSQFLLGLLYAREGLLDDAEAKWSQLEKENSGSELVGKLLTSLRTMRGGRSDEN